MSVVVVTGTGTGVGKTIATAARACHARIGGLDVDVRVSTIPSQYGERVVLRLLDRGSTSLDLVRYLSQHKPAVESVVALIAPHSWRVV